MAGSFGSDGRFWPCNEDLHWCWFSPHGFPGYVVCLYVVACDKVYFSLIIMLMLLGFNLTERIGHE